MTTKDKQILANNYYCKAMQLFEDHDRGLDEFYNLDDVFNLLYDIASDFQAIMQGDL